MATDKGKAAVEASLRQAPIIRSDPNEGDSVNKEVLVAGVNPQHNLASPKDQLVAGQSDQQNLTSTYEKTLRSQGLRSSRQSMLVAGVGFEPTTFRL